MVTLTVKNFKSLNSLSRTENLTIMQRKLRSSELKSLNHNLRRQGIKSSKSIKVSQLSISEHIATLFASVGNLCTLYKSS